jgi:N-acetylmuramoyl-L-alanine amidase
MYTIKDNHWLRKANSITALSCMKNKTLFEAGQPDSIIIHYTAGRDAESSANYLCREDVKASAHLVVGRKNEIFQLIPFNTVAWHAGKSSLNGRIGFNRFSIGIEIDNAGVLEKNGDGYMAWFGKRYSENEVIKAVHCNESTEKYWHTYTENQIHIVEDLCQSLMNKYNTITQIFGHEEISKGRKQDPGPAFPLDKIRNRLLQDRDSESAVYENMNGEVDVQRLNIRSLPDVNSDPVNSPLAKGTKVKILQKHSGWYQVKTEIEGWVSSEYISLE